MATLNEQQLTHRINFLLGKNGCGKSTALRQLVEKLRRHADWFIKYITPERGGADTMQVSTRTSSRQERGWMTRAEQIDSTNFANKPFRSRTLELAIEK